APGKPYAARGGWVCGFETDGRENQPANYILLLRLRASVQYMVYVLELAPDYSYIVSPLDGFSSHLSRKSAGQPYFEVILVRPALTPRPMTAKKPSSARHHDRARSASP